MDGVIEFTRELIETSNVSAIDSRSLGNCPRCSNLIIKGWRDYGCSKWKEECKFVIRRDYKGIELNVRQIQALLQHKVLLRPIRDKDGVEWVLYLSNEGHLMSIEVPKKDRQKPVQAKSQKSEKDVVSTSQPATQDSSSVGDCPLCRQKVVAHENEYRCSNLKEQCNFSFSKKFYGKKIVLSSVKTLLKKGKTSKAQLPSASSLPTPVISSILGFQMIYLHWWSKARIEGGADTVAVLF